MKKIIAHSIKDHIENISNLQTDSYYELIEEMSLACCESIKKGKKILVCGNGGSAADAQHLVAELVGRFMRERRALPAISLTTDTSIITSVGNDYDFDHIFQRQVEALGDEGDILIGISTSGNSRNVLNAMIQAKKQGMITIGFLGKDGGKIAEETDYRLIVGGENTARIQEAHLLTYHILCDLIESWVYGEENNETKVI